MNQREMLGPGDRPCMEDEGKKSPIIAPEKRREELPFADSH